MPKVWPSRVGKLYQNQTSSSHPARRGPSGSLILHVYARQSTLPRPILDNSAYEQLTQLGEYIATSHDFRQYQIRSSTRSRDHGKHWAHTLTTSSAKIPPRSRVSPQFRTSQARRKPRKQTTAMEGARLCAPNLRLLLCKNNQDENKQESDWANAAGLPAHPPLKHPARSEQALVVIADRLHRVRPPGPWVELGTTT
jgi:hypothetical protein